MLMCLFLKEKFSSEFAFCVPHFKEITPSSIAVWFGINSQLVNAFHFPH